MRRSYLYAILLFSLVIQSCDDAVYNKMKPVSPEGWHMNEPVKFDVEVSDTSTLYDFYVMIRHQTDYAYSNLYCFVSTTMPGDSISTDTIEFVLAQPDGTWIGNGTGSLRTNDVLISRKFVFPSTGLYSFEFTQAMRDTMLTGITDLGIRITPTPL